MKLPRKAIRVTRNDGEDFVYPSVKVASEQTGHSYSTLMRLAATSEVVNGCQFSLVDHVPKVRHAVSVTFDEDTYNDLFRAAGRSGKKLPVYVRDAIADYLKVIALVPRAQQ